MTTAVASRLNVAVQERYAELESIGDVQAVRYLIDVGAMLALHEVERYLVACDQDEAAGWVRVELDAIRTGDDA